MLVSFHYISQRPLSSPYTEYQSLLKSVTALEMLGFSKIAFNTLTGAVTAWLPAFLSFYNARRPHAALGDKPPASRLGGNNLLQTDS